MQVPFSELPGRHERHYCRKLDNPLFGDLMLQRDDEAIHEVQRLDHEELIAFISELRSTVERAVQLKPNEESDVILKLKEDLDRLYETSAGLADEQGGNQQAIQQLLAIIMKTIRQAAGNDSLATQELDGETRARTEHFNLLREPLVADVLHPESVIKQDELAATLLSESESAVEAVVGLFDLDQLTLLQKDAKTLLEKLMPDAAANPEAWARMAQIDAQLNMLMVQVQSET